MSVLRMHTWAMIHTPRLWQWNWGVSDYEGGVIITAGQSGHLSNGEIMRLLNGEASRYGMSRSGQSPDGLEPPNIDVVGDVGWGCGWECGWNVVGSTLGLPINGGINTILNYWWGTIDWPVPRMTVMSCNILWHLLTNSSPVLSYHHHHSLQASPSSRTLSPPMQITSHSCEYSPYLHLHTLKPWLCSSSTLIILHASCNSLTHNSHFKYNFPHVFLLCSDSDPGHIYYVISLHIITLTFSSSLTLHPHSCQYCCVPF